MRSALRAMKYAPQTSDWTPKMRLNCSVSRNSRGNGYHAHASAPASGRRIAVETRKARPQAAFTSTGWAR